MVASPMLDLVTFVLASVPIVAGLALVLFSLKERSRVAAAPVKACESNTPIIARSAASHRT
jgi:hypothetical protein